MVWKGSREVPKHTGTFLMIWNQTCTSCSWGTCEPGGWTAISSCDVPWWLFLLSDLLSLGSFLGCGVWFSRFHWFHCAGNCGTCCTVEFRVARSWRCRLSFLLLECLGVSRTASWQSIEQEPVEKDYSFSPGSSCIWLQYGQGSDFVQTWLDMFFILFDQMLWSCKPVFYTYMHWTR